MSETTDALGSLEVALEHTAKLLDVDPALAAEQAEEILKAIPNHFWPWRGGAQVIHRVRSTNSSYC